MKLANTTVIALALLANVAAHAKTTTTMAPEPTTGAGRLGHRYTELSFGFENVDHLSAHGYSVGAGDDEAIWGAAVGIEIPAGIVTITPRISYPDDFDGSARGSKTWTGSVEANYWYSRTSAVYTSLGRTDVRHSPYDSWNWEIGLRARF
jgi:hypothetical protein